MNAPEKTAAPTWIEFLVVTTGSVWCGVIGFFLDGVCVKLIRRLSWHHQD